MMFNILSVVANFKFALLILLTLTACENKDPAESMIRGTQFERELHTDEVEVPIADDSEEEPESVLAPEATPIVLRAPEADPVVVEESTFEEKTEEPLISDEIEERAIPTPIVEDQSELEPPTEDDFVEEEPVLPGVLEGETEPSTISTPVVPDEYLEIRDLVRELTLNLQEETSIESEIESGESTYWLVHFWLPVNVEGEEESFNSLGIGLDRTLSERGLRLLAQEEVRFGSFRGLRALIHNPYQESWSPSLLDLEIENLQIQWLPFVHFRIDYYLSLRISGETRGPFFLGNIPQLNSQRLGQFHLDHPLSILETLSRGNLSCTSIDAPCLSALAGLAETGELNLFSIQGSQREINVFDWLALVSRSNIDELENPLTESREDLLENIIIDARIWLPMDQQILPVDPSALIPGPVLSENLETDSFIVDGENGKLGISVPMAQSRSEISSELQRARTESSPDWINFLRLVSSLGAQPSE